MKITTPTEMKSILHSKRANLYYLEHCRVLVNGGCVDFVTEEGNRSLYWNIPIANTTTVLLGSGTSITQVAMREFSKAGVLVGFCGGSGAPLFSAVEVEPDVTWLSPQSEYRPTEYLQSWVKFWFSDEARLKAAITFQSIRIEQIRKAWIKINQQNPEQFSVNSAELERVLNKFERNIQSCATSSEVLSQEALMTKSLYRIVASTVMLWGICES